MDASVFPLRRTGDLHRGRSSIPGCCYFTTIVTRDRKPWFAEPAARRAVLEVFRACETDGGNSPLALSVMPDHIHILFELGGRLTVGQVVARWKVEIRKAIGHAVYFQRDFWEHALRSAETIEDYALYIFLNPYRAGLASPEQGWDGWWTPDPSLFRFISLLDGNDGPPAEWIEWTEECFNRLAHGE